MTMARSSPDGEQPRSNVVPDSPTVGDSVSSLHWCDASGREVRISDFRGSPVVLVLHAQHWDPAAPEHVASYNRVIARLSGAAGTRLLSIDGRGTWRELGFSDTSLAMPILSSDAAEIAKQLGVTGAAVLVIDRDGIVRWKHCAGDALPSPDELGRALLSLASSATAGTTTQRADRAEHASRSGPRGDWTRREFVAAALGASFALALLPLTKQADALAQAAMSSSSPPTPAPAAQPVTLTVNGRELQLNIEPRVTLLDALREYAMLTGTKKGCDHGQCGACTVHIDGRRHLSCLTFAMMHQGKQITTIEGLAHGTELHPMQEAFLRHDGFQCGYCTPGTDHVGDCGAERAVGSDRRRRARSDER